jgi:cytosine/adenosine deaminase-related metal-dependent hydrolase
MRTYPRNSPQAAARIVALTVLADGDVGVEEIDLLDRLGAHSQLGLSRHELHQVMDHFCEDLLSGGHLTWADACPVDERTLAALMADIGDPALRRTLLRLCVDLAEIDARVDEGESVVLGAAVEHWGLHHEMLDKPSKASVAAPE